MADPSLPTMLASSFLAGDLQVEQIIERSSQMLGRRWPWVPPLANRFVRTYANRTRPRHRAVLRFLYGDAGFQRAWARHGDKLTVRHWLLPSQRVQPVAAAREWNLPRLETPVALAEWLGIASEELEWFADLKELCRKTRIARLQNYHYRVFEKYSGSVRLVEAPKGRLKKLQRQILGEILQKIPAHQAVHGFVKRRWIKTFVAPHVGQRVVLKMDLQDFFPSVVLARVQSFFRTIGYPEQVADLLGGICTNATPWDAWSRAGGSVNPLKRRELHEMYRRRHLPQGVPTSPALANLCFYRADCRLVGLAKSAGAAYTRYADDLAFSGGPSFESRSERFCTHVAAILHEEGFRANHRKTRIMRSGVRQHLAGIVVNEKENVVRRDFDRLKATLTNCIRFGPASQNRDAHPEFRSHLDGRVSFVEAINPNRGKRLRGLFDRVLWA